MALKFSSKALKGELDNNRTIKTEKTTAALNIQVSLVGDKDQKIDTPNHLADQQNDYVKPMDSIRDAYSKQESQSQIENNNQIEETNSNMESRLSDKVNEPPKKQFPIYKTEKEKILDSLSTALECVQQPFKIIMIGGRPEYYEEIFAWYHEANSNVVLVEQMAGAGDRAYWNIESMDPDLIIIHHASQIKSATQFIKSLETQVNSHNVLLKEAYKNKRILVIAPEDPMYEDTLKSMGIKYIIKENVQDGTIDLNVFTEMLKDIFIEVKELKRREQIENQHFSEEELLQKKAKTVSKVIGVYSATGGVGKTIFATNLATILGRYGNMNGKTSRICVVEFTLGEKEIDLFMGIKWVTKQLR